MKNLALTFLLCCAPIFTASVCQAQEIPGLEHHHTESQFRAKLVVVDEVTPDELEKPSNEVPHNREVGTAKIGDVVALELIFTGMDLRENGTAEVTFDIAVTQPDGTLYGGSAHENITALKQEIFERERIFTSDATLVIGFEPEDPLGVYEIKMTVKDVVGGHQLILEETLTLVE